MKKIRNKLAEYCGMPSNVPEDCLSSDLFLVEYPKSGITWLSVLIANMALIQSGMSQRATFYNVQQYVPDVHMSSMNIGPRLHAEPPMRFIKSHSKYNSEYNQVIYLVRHPLNVMLSYYNYLGAHGKSMPSFDKFLKNKKYGLPSWRKHVLSWLGSQDQANRLHMVRYEDMLKDTQTEILKINMNLGWGISEDVIKKAISLSDIHSMRQSESIYRQMNPRYRLKFVRNNKKIVLDKSLINKVEDECMLELQLLGYSDE